MPDRKSLDELISSKAEHFADSVATAASKATKEEEVRIAVERALALLQKDLGIELNPRHEFTVASGRVDSVYDSVLIEYKNPSSTARLGPTLTTPGVKKVVQQIKSRFADLKNEHQHPLNSLLGVGLDGRFMVFVRYRDNAWVVDEPVQFTRASAERFLWALFNLSQKGRPYSPTYLARDFGASAPGAKACVAALYGALQASSHPRVSILFQQWKILFAEVCGYDVDKPTEKILALAQLYSVPTRQLNSAALLFALHTYYAIFMKLLASEIVAFFHELDTPAQKLRVAATSSKFKDEVTALEDGGIFRQLNITNFLEGDLFAWYLDAWTADVEQAIRTLVNTLDSYNPGTLSEDPAGSRDLLKKLYQELVPKSVRHDLGEYYTPDWLADSLITELDYSGDHTLRVLDPACGSGTFLVMAINRILQKRKNHWSQADDLSPKSLGTAILDNVVGFDLNPLAVLAARTNYLVAIRGFLHHLDSVEIPVYLADSILTPSEYGDLFSGQLGDVKEVKTAAGRFLVPKDITTERHTIGRYTELLESCVENSYSASDFLHRCKSEGLPVSHPHLHTDLYSQIVKLQRTSRNGVWARILKNAFAPLFIGKVDCVVGNPPWVRYGYLPAQYRVDVEHLWRRYELFTQSGLAAKMGTAELDISILFTYVCLDHYLKDKGRLGFLLTQEVIRSKSAGEGFRRFVLTPSKIPLKVLQFHDLVSVKPFDAANKACFICVEKGKQTSYPVPYIEWTVKKGQRIAPEDSLEEVLTRTTRTKKTAKPLSGPLSPWQVIATGSGAALHKLAGKSSYEGRRGVSVDPYAVFSCRVLKTFSDGHLLVENDPTIGKSVVPKMPPTRIESDRVFPMVRGRDIARWSAKPVLAAIIINESTRKDDIPSEADVRRTYPKTFAYLNRMRDAALRRELYWQFFAKRIESATPLTAAKQKALGAYVRSAGKSAEGQHLYEVADAPFFTLFNVGTYTFGAYRVVWPMGASKMRAAVVGTANLGTSTSARLRKPTIPATGTVSYSAFNHEDPAFFLCALLNSAPVDAYIRSFSSPGRGFGAPSVVQKIALPDYDAKDKAHGALVRLSKKCHAAAAASSSATLAALELEVDAAVGKVFGLTVQEMTHLRPSLKPNLKDESEDEAD